MFFPPSCENRPPSFGNHLLDILPRDLAKLVLDFCQETMAEGCKALLAMVEEFWNSPNLFTLPVREHAVFINDEKEMSGLRLYVKLQVVSRWSRKLLFFVVVCDNPPDHRRGDIHMTFSHPSGALIKRISNSFQRWEDLGTKIGNIQDQQIDWSIAAWSIPSEPSSRAINIASLGISDTTYLALLWKKKRDTFKEKGH